MITKYEIFDNKNKSIFNNDIQLIDELINEIVVKSKFLIIGAAGSIGSAVTKEIFKRNPLAIHLVDISENNLVELVRDLRSSVGYISGDFKTYAIDCGSIEFEAMMNSSTQYDYVINLSALKHVRSERDPYTLMRLIDVNIINTIKTLDLSYKNDVSKYFCVSTDKAANPINMMGASKSIMEKFIFNYSKKLPVSTARFANVAFSDGSLLHSFIQRFEKQQPLSAPRDIKRYFITPKESGELCLLSCLFGDNCDIYFPKLNNLYLYNFSELAIRFLKTQGYSAKICLTEEEARNNIESLIKKKIWPCYFFNSDTTGEKEVEEFYTDNEIVNLNKFTSIGIVKKNTTNISSDNNDVGLFLEEIIKIKNRSNWSKDELINLFELILPDFKHDETGKNLDGKM